MARNRYAGYCYCCGKYVPSGYGHFERTHDGTANKFTIKCVRCASGRIVKDSDKEVQRVRNREETKMLKEIRESRGMSQQDLAAKSGINKRMIQAYEQGYRNINGAKLSTLVTFCIVLECHLSEIVDDAQLVKDLKAYESL